ncbi:MAG: glycosyltransferase family 4 protein [Thiotrichaceae bacterium]|nr:glycosyltransferase family 4 protein [Thiotrichaceae bacterium]
MKTNSIKQGGHKIAIMITRSNVGGAQIHIKDIALGLKSYGNQVFIIVGELGEFTTLLDELNLDYHYIPELQRSINIVKDIKAYFSIKKYLKNIKPDLLSTHSSKAGMLGRIVARQLSIPATFTAHGWSFTDGVSPIKKIIYKTLERLASHLPGKIITVSKFDYQLAIKYKICPKEKLVAIQNGMPDIAPELYANPSTQPPKIVMVARFCEQKDHMSLIHALSHISSTHWELEFIGDGDSRALQAKINYLSLKQQIKISGYQSNINEILSTSQIVVLSSHWEGLPLTIIEAMRAGLPVIASDVGGVSEAVIDGKTGYLTHSVDELATRLELLITNPILRQQLGSQARIAYQNNLTLKQQLNKTFDVYDQVMTDHTAKPHSKPSIA